MKEIMLTKGYVAIVDDKDYEWLSQFKWCADVAKSGRVCAARRFGIGFKRTAKVLMHRFIMDAPDDKFVDHRNGNALDNRRDNLRICTKSQNGMNRGVQLNNLVGYCGVGRKGNSFSAKIKLNGEVIYLKSYPSAIKAAYAYDIAAERYHGEFAKLNFPHQGAGLLYACGHEIQKMSNRKFFKKAPDNQIACAPCAGIEWTRLL